MPVCAVILGVHALRASETLKLDGAYHISPAKSPDQPPGNNAKWSKGNMLRDLRGEHDKKKIHNVWIKTCFTPPETWNDSRVLLDFKRVDGNAIIFINGKKVGERLGPSGDIDISEYVKAGSENELLAFVTRDYTGISRNIQSDPIRNSARGPDALFNTLPLSSVRLGIDPPSLIRLPKPAAVVDAWTETSFRKKKIDVKVELDTIKSGEYKLECDIFDAEKKKVMSLEKTFNAKPGKTKLNLSEHWGNPHTWELDGGYLYTAVVMVKDEAGNVLDDLEFPFGFREIWTAGKEIYLNGHPIRFRVEWTSFGLNENSLSLLKLLGRNMVYQQSNPMFWWRDWSVIPTYSESMLELCDKNGIAVFLPIPTVNYARNVYTDPQFRKDFRHETEEIIRRYRRHPSVLAWCVSMNSFNPRDGIHPCTLGRRADYKHIQAKVIDYAIDQAHEIDSTRLAYAHADGNIGDIASGNVYPNFAPAQEVADWPEHWSKHGDMPWWACEYAAIYDGSYYKGSSFLLTEYAAIYMGEKAYGKETMTQLKKTIKNGVKSKPHGNILKIYQDAPLYFDMQKIYIDATDRAWRTYGVQGWHYFNFGVGYGEPPERGNRERPYDRYLAMTKPVNSRPDWANPLFDAHAANTQKLLIYIGGSPAHTDKTHSYRGGEIIEKNIAVVWDGPGDIKLNADCQLLDSNGKAVASEHKNIILKNGDIKLVPVRFTAPEVDSKRHYQISLKVTGYEDQIVTDRFNLEVFPNRLSVSRAAGRVILFDPLRKSQWVQKRISTVLDYSPEINLKDGDLLVLGRESLKLGMKLPYRAEDIKKGLKVVILEQKPEIFEAFGFRCIDPGTRLTYFGCDPGVLAEGLDNSDLKHWRGTPDLLPEFKHARAYDVRVAPKSSNRNTVASTVIEIPVVPSFEALVVAEFDMAYSPLLRWNYGKGSILFSLFDFSGRAGVDPAATKLADNLLKYAEQMKNTPETILVNNGSYSAKSRDVLKQGGVVLNIALPAAKLRELGVATNPKTLYRVKKPGVLSKVAPRNLLRWRDELKVEAICNPGAVADGIYYERKVGEGKEIFLEVSPDMLLKRYAKDPKRAEAVSWSVIRLKQLISAILTANGADASVELANKICSLKKDAGYKNLVSWQILGPYFGASGQSACQLLNTEYPGEKQALAGDTNPNFTYTTRDGRKLDFREIVEADSNGYVDLAAGFNTSNDKALGFAVKEIKTEKAYTAFLRLGFDFFLKAYLNGELVADYSRGFGSNPGPNKFKLKVKLKKGLNILTFKLLSGSKGFGFWANISEPGMTFENAVAKPKESLYDPDIKLRSPYEFHYW